MENDKSNLNAESVNQTLKEDKALELLDKLDKITLTDDFNKAVLARIKKEKTATLHNWYKPFAAIAASIVVATVIWNFQKSTIDEHLVKVPRSDILVIENLDLLDKMEILDHLDVLADTAATQVFLQLLENG